MKIVRLEKQASGNYKKIIDREWLYQKYVIERLPVEAIAKLAKINARLITKRAEEYGFPIRSKKDRYKLRSERNEPWNKGLSKNEHPSLLDLSKRQKENSHFADPDWRKNNLFTEEVKAKRSAGLKEAHQKKWANLTREEKIEKWKQLGHGMLPNKTEQFLLSLCPEQVEYTGNRQHWVTFKCGRNKNPDYVVRPFKSRKKVIEYFGSYWHQDEEEKQELIEKYAEVGIECLVILESDLKNIENVRARIVEFVNVK